MKQLFISICIILLGFTTLLHAKPLINWHDGTTSYTDYDVEYFEEKADHPLTFQQIRSQNFQLINNNFTFGYNTNNFWFRLRVFNDSNTSKDIYLELTEIIHKHLDLYIISSDNTVKFEKNGLSVPVDQRQIKVSNPTFSIHFDPFEEKELYIKLNSIYGVFGAIHLKTPEHFHDTNHFKENLYMFYYGAVLTLVLYNLFIFFYLKEIIYFYYVSYVSIFIIWSANYKGILLPYTSMATYDQLQISIPVFFSLLILFSQAVLQTRKYFIYFNYWLNVFIVILMISLVWMLIDLHSGFTFMNMIASPLLPFLLVVAFWALYKGHNIAKIYLLALSIYLISMAILSQMALGVIPYSLLTSNAPIIGSFFEIILLSLLLAYRINILREEKIKTQNILLEHKANEEIRLTKMVKDKTDELNILNKRLEIELQEKMKLEQVLLHEVATDSLTGILNRRAFFKECVKEMNTAKRYRYDLSLIIIDIDYFKDINDKYGHLNGDIVLIDVVKTIKSTIRSTDIFGRIGGEEFAVLMPQTNLDNATQLAERIRKNIENSEIYLEDERVNVTASIGLSYLKTEDSIIQNILRRADEALFKAKKNGRNQLFNSDQL